MEAIAYIRARPFSDHPVCVHPALVEVGINTNDSAGSQERRNELLPLIERFINTRAGGKKQSRTLALAAIEWGRLKAITRADERIATALRTIPAVRDLKTVRTLAATLHRNNFMEEGDVATACEEFIMGNYGGAVIDIASGYAYTHEQRLDVLDHMLTAIGH